MRDKTFWALFAAGGTSTPPTVHACEVEAGKISRPHLTCVPVSVTTWSSAPRRSVHLVPDVVGFCMLFEWSSTSRMSPEARRGMNEFWPQPGVEEAQAPDALSHTRPPPHWVSELQWPGPDAPPLPPPPAPPFPQVGPYTP